MSRTDIEAIDLHPRPRTMTVLVLLIVAAMTLSYLWAYAVTNALVSANILAPWPPAEDPRPRQMIEGFLLLCGLFAFIAAVARFLSYRQLKHIDLMVEDVDC